MESRGHVRNSIPFILYDSFQYFVSGFCTDDQALLSAITYVHGILQDNSLFCFLSGPGCLDCPLDHQSIDSPHVLKPSAQDKHKDGSAKVRYPQFISHKTTLPRSAIASILTKSKKKSHPASDRPRSSRDSSWCMLMSGASTPWRRTPGASIWRCSQMT